MLHCSKTSMRDALNCNMWSLPYICPDLTFNLIVDYQYTNPGPPENYARVLTSKPRRNQMFRIFECILMNLKIRKRKRSRSYLGRCTVQHLPEEAEENISQDSQSPDRNLRNAVHVIEEVNMLAWTHFRVYPRLMGLHGTSPQSMQCVSVFRGIQVWEKREELLWLAGNIMTNRR